MSIKRTDPSFWETPGFSRRTCVFIGEHAPAEHVIQPALEGDGHALLAFLTLLMVFVTFLLMLFVTLCVAFTGFFFGGSVIFMRESIGRSLTPSISMREYLACTRGRTTVSIWSTV